MTITIQVEDVIRKNELLRKEFNGNKLTEDEVKELKGIQDYLDKILREVLDLHSRGFKLVNGDPVKMDDIKSIREKERKQEKRNSLKLTPTLRKERAMEILTKMRGENKTDKDIIKAMSLEIGVSNTYGYKLVKENPKK